MPAEKNRNEFHLIVDKLPMGILILGKKGIIYANKKFHKISAVSGGLLGSTIGDALLAAPLGEVESLEKKVNTHLSKKSTRTKAVVLQWNDRKGRPRFFDVFLQTIDFQGQTAVQLVFNDTTLLRSSERKLSEQRETLQHYLDIAGAAIVVLDTFGKVTFANRKATEMLEYSESEFMGLDWFETIMPPRIRLDMRSVFQSVVAGEVETIEYYNNPVLTKRGVERIVAWRDTALSDKDGNIIGVLSSGVDITESQRAASELKAAVETSMLYLDLMGHDIRNQLQAITMSADLLKDTAQSPEGGRLLEYVISAADVCDALIDKVHATEHLLSVPLGDVSLKETLEQTLDLFRRKHRKVKVTVDYSGLDPVVRADSYLENLLREILENAVKHNPKEEKQVWVCIGQRDDGFEIAVSDNGPGMSEKMKLSLFDLEKRLGGVGAQQIKHIVDKYRGHIAVVDRIEGEPKQGVEIRVWLPSSKH
ncbi:MAG: PAS domain-containing sensor histidine kinase [Candidatus Thorarchaeota archaeon]|jgi:PAS domain S-box-containing protein|nr:PAS domain-containing sensor histidine kinase [Candidatus Thorarchaeota archaeon]